MNWQPILFSLIISVLTSLLGYCVGKFRNSFKELGALKSGLQALLRDRMLTLYFEARSKGSTTIENKNNFDNLYNNYHALGLNGVMDQIHEEYMDMEVSD